MHTDTVLVEYVKTITIHVIQVQWNTDLIAVHKVYDDKIAVPAVT